MNFRNVIISLLVAPLIAACWELERGEKVGQILSITKSGVFVKTWKCKLIRGGMDDGSGAFGNSMWLNIEDDKLLHDLQKAMIDRRFININYHKEAFAPFRSDDDDKLFLDSFVIKESNNG